MTGARSVDAPQARQGPLPPLLNAICTAAEASVASSFNRRVPSLPTDWVLATNGPCATQGAPGLRAPRDQKEEGEKDKRWGAKIEGEETAGRSNGSGGGAQGGKETGGSGGSGALLNARRDAPGTCRRQDAEIPGTSRGALRQS